MGKRQNSQPGLELSARRTPSARLLHVEVPAGSSARKKPRGAHGILGDRRPVERLGEGARPLTSGTRIPTS